KSSRTFHSTSNDWNTSYAYGWSCFDVLCTRETFHTAKAHCHPSRFSCIAVRACNVHWARVGYGTMDPDCKEILRVRTIHVAVVSDPTSLLLSAFGKLLLVRITAASGPARYYLHVSTYESN